MTAPTMITVPMTANRSTAVAVGSPAARPSMSRVTSRIALTLRSGRTPVRHSLSGRYASILLLDMARITSLA